MQMLACTGKITLYITDAHHVYIMTLCSGGALNISKTIHEIRRGRWKCWTWNWRTNLQGMKLQDMKLVQKRQTF